jgi:hypothetical protein
VSAFLTARWGSDLTARGRAPRLGLDPGLDSVLLADKGHAIMSDAIRGQDDRSTGAVVPRQMNAENSICCFLRRFL